MKKTYRERFNDVSLKEDYKADVLQSVLDYEEPKQKKFKTKSKWAVVAVTSVFVFSTLFFATGMFSSKNGNSFVIKANDEVYSVTKSDIKLNNIDRVIDVHSFWSTYPKDGNLVMETSPLDSPLALYVEGDNIASITYTLNNAKFYKFEENYGSEKSRLEENDTCRDGCYLIPKESYPMMHKIDEKRTGNPDKLYWSIEDVEPNNQITINYEDQRTVNVVYGVAFCYTHKGFTDKELSDEYDATSKEADRVESELKKEAQKQNGAAVEELIDKLSELDSRLGKLFSKEVNESTILKIINQSELTVRVNYKDGTYETTKLKFKAEDNKSTSVTNE